MNSFRNNPESKWTKFYLPFWEPAPELGLYSKQDLITYTFLKKIFLRKKILTFKIVQV